MQQRRLGRTGISVSVLGMGCGAVGGLMVMGTAAEQERAVGRAMELGITYFDTAADYGAGASENNLGRALKSLKADVVVGTKVGVYGPQRDDIPAAIAGSVAASLTRLGRDSVDILHLHNTITVEGDGRTLRPEQIFAEAVPTLERLRDEGKFRYFGFTGLGDSAAVRRLMTDGGFSTAQLPYNVLNPSGVSALPAGSTMPDLAGIIVAAAANDVGVIAIRVLAGGALSGSTDRAPLAAQLVEPIASGVDYAADVAAARALQPLVDAGYAHDLVELALRFAIGPSEIGTILVGTASQTELEHAIASVEKGPLPQEAYRALNG